MKITAKEINFINVLLGAIVLVVTFYIGYLATNHLVNSPALARPESKLPLAVSPKWDNATLNKDMQGISAVVNQINADQNVASSSLSAKALNLDSQAAVIGARSSLNLATQKLEATAQLPKSDQVRFRAQITSINASLQKLLDSIVINSKTAMGISARLSSLNNRVDLAKVADDQQVCEIRLSKIAANLNMAINASSLSAPDITNLQADLTTMSSDASAGASISSLIEQDLSSTTLTLANLISQNTQLATAQRDILAAINPADTIISNL